VGYFAGPEQVFDLGCRISAITHGHVSGYLAAGFLAQIICGISYGRDLPQAIEESLAVLKTYAGCEECLEAVNQAVDAWKSAPVCFETLETLGQGWIAEEALAIGLYCALAAGNDFQKGICLSVNHSGDSDSTGSICGNILGALLGADAIPPNYLAKLELADAISEIATDLFERMPDKQ
jgi:ADP-ribosylglycohydrolase